MILWRRRPCRREVCNLNQFDLELQYLFVYWYYALQSPEPVALRWHTIRIGATNLTGTCNTAENDSVATQTGFLFTTFEQNW